MAFTAQDVKELREITGCGMMDCKKALTETNGDKDKAVEYLREKGLATAAKKAGRIASEGIVKAYLTDDKKVGVLVEVGKGKLTKEEVKNMLKTGVKPAKIKTMPPYGLYLLSVEY